MESTINSWHSGMNEPHVMLTKANFQIPVDDTHNSKNLIKIPGVLMRALQMGGMMNQTIHDQQKQGAMNDG